MRWTLEWTGAHLSNILMHECGTRSGGRSSIVSQASTSYSRREKGSGKQHTIRLPRGMHMTSSNVMSQTANSFVRTYSLVVHFILRFNCGKMSASVSRVDKPLQRMIIHNEVF